MRHHPEVETRSTGKRSLPSSAPAWVHDELADKRENHADENRSAHGGGGLTVNEPHTYEPGNGRSFFADLRAAALAAILQGDPITVADAIIGGKRGKAPDPAPRR